MTMDSHKTDGDISTPPAIIEQIRIADLFGRFTYHLKLQPRLQLGSTQRLLLLYGDNGSGKTTILKLIYRLLSPALNRGHRTYLARAPFSTLEIVLSNGDKISATKWDETIGSYTIHIASASTGSFSIDYQVDEETTRIPRRRGLPVSSEERSYHQFLTGFQLVPYFLADDRSIYSDNIEREEDDERADPMRLIHEYEYRRRPGTRQEWEDELRARELQGALAVTEEYFRGKLYQGATAGYASASQVYIDVLSRIASYGEARTLGESETRAVLDKLLAVGAANQRFEEFGLGAPLDIQALYDLLASAPPERTSLMAEVLAPYLDGVEARLSALADIEDEIRTLVSTINEYFAHKALYFHANRGLRIVTDEGEPLAPGTLSSGERQLLLLFCRAISASHDTRLFIIDEPELSLNIKWQRQLLNSLLRCTQSSGMQFIVATHSIELLAQFESDIVKLTPG